MEILLILILKFKVRSNLKIYSCFLLILSNYKNKINNILYLYIIKFLKFKS